MLSRYRQATCCPNDNLLPGNMLPWCKRGFRDYGMLFSVSLSSTFYTLYVYLFRFGLILVNFLLFSNLYIFNLYFLFVI